MADRSLEPNSKIYPLTSVRFLAALYVVIDHGRGVVPMLSVGSAYLREFAALGYIAVNFFFVLSGYILAVVYLQGQSGVNRRNFWIARFARIYPIYLIALALDCPHFVHTWAANRASGMVQPSIFSTLSINALLLQAWWTRFLGINIPGWSLSAEAFFYAVFPFAGVLLWRLRRGGVFVWASVIYLIGNLLVVGLAQYVEFAPLRYNPASHLYEFLLGILTARLHYLLQQDSASAAWVQRASPWLLAASVGAYLSIVPWADRIQVQLLTHGIFSPLFCIAVLALASGNFRINQLFSTTWMVLLGEASYALYLIHEPVFFMLRVPLQKYAGPAFAGYLVLCIGLSVMSYWYIERPSRRWIVRRWGGRNRESEAAAAVAQ